LILEIKVVLLKREEAKTTTIVPLIKSELINMNMRYKTRTYGTTIYGSIGGMTSAYFNAIEPGMAKDQTLYLIQTPMSTDPKAKPLIRFHLFLVSACKFGEQCFWVTLTAEYVVKLLINSWAH